MEYDAIVIGGSYAGMAAALQLVRARRHVLVIDAGLRRNRMASHSHGFLSQDGVDPGIIADTARAQLAAYPTLAWQEAEVVETSGSKDAFMVHTHEGAGFRARRLLFATGVSDTLPSIDGLAERWGQHVFHCPYCHGYELHNGRIGVIAASAMSLHQAQLLPEWGDVTFFPNRILDLDASAREALSARGVVIDPATIVRIQGNADVVLDDGRSLTFDGLFIAPRNAPSTPVAGRMGCALMETPMGSQIRTGDDRETSIPGVFACGDVARVPHSVSLAVGDGAWAGAQLHRSLVWP